MPPPTCELCHLGPAARGCLGLCADCFLAFTDENRDASDELRTTSNSDGPPSRGKDD